MRLGIKAAGAGVFAKVNLMSRAPCTFKQGDVTRALRATVAAGVAIRRVEIDPDGKIVVIIGTPEDPLSSPQDDLDQELEEFEARHES